MRCVLLILLLLCSQQISAALDERIKVTIEEPVEGGSYSAISNLRGWAVSPEGIGNYLLNVYVDGEFAFHMAPYGERSDVGNAFPDYPDSATGGFSMAFNYKNLTPGRHEITVRAYDNNDNYNEATVTFTAERFVSPYINADSEVNLTTLDRLYFYDDQSLLLNGVTVEGKKWDFVLKWDRASQSFKTRGIEPYGGDLNNAGNQYNPGSGSGSGSSFQVYACLTSPSETGRTSDELVYFKNGLVVRNNQGAFWSTSDEHIVFKTETSRWYSIINQEEKERLDVVEEPESCFEADYGEVVGVRNRQGEKVLSLAGSPGGTAELEAVVSSTCDFVVGTPWQAYENGFPARSYVVSLRTADSCRVTEVIEL